MSWNHFHGLYAALCIAKGEENLNVAPFRDWVGLTSIDAGLRKAPFLLHPLAADKIRELVKGPYQALLLSTFRGLWHEQGEASFNQTEASLPSDESLLAKVLGVWDCPPAEWIDF